MEYKIGNGTIQILLTESTSKTIIGEEIPEKTFFYGEIKGYPDDFLFVRLYDCIVSLTTFESWYLDTKIENYKPIQVEITIKTKEEE